VLSTLQRIKEELLSDSLVHRYELGRAVGDGLPGLEGTFSICTFWMVEALSRAGRLDEARFIFETMLTYDPRGPRQFPQALTIIGLINAAFELDRALSRTP
jgi:pentatricopeptide repeat protein